MKSQSFKGSILVSLLLGTILLIGSTMASLIATDKKSYVYTFGDAKVEIVNTLNDDPIKGIIGIKNTGNVPVVARMRVYMEGQGLYINDVGTSESFRGVGIRKDEKSNTESNAHIDNVYLVFNRDQSIRDLHKSLCLYSYYTYTPVIKPNETCTIFTKIEQGGAKWSKFTFPYILECTAVDVSMGDNLWKEQFKSNEHNSETILSRYQETVDKYRNSQKK